MQISLMSNVAWKTVGAMQEIKSSPGLAATLGWDILLKEIENTQVEKKLYF